MSLRKFIFFNLIFLLMSTTNVWPEDGGEFTNSIGQKFVLIPAGEFMMGSPAGEPQRFKRERQHRVVISKPFHMMATEVTQGQWSKVMGTNPSQFKDCGDNCPVVNVSWNEIQEFIKRLNAQDGTKEYRLPTEAEWEYAARAGSVTAFANGEIKEFECNHDPNLAQMGWYCGNANKKIHPVACKQPNAWGIYDMHGNVWEWCQDWLGGYPSGSTVDPVGPSSGSLKVYRGGAFNFFAHTCRSAYRDGDKPGFQCHDTGFRLAF